MLLTNGIHWQAHVIKFEKPISHELVFDFKMTDLSMRSQDNISTLFLICRESLSKGKPVAIEKFHEYSQIINRHTIAAVMQTENIAKAVRRELRQLSPKSKVSLKDVAELILETLKRDVVEGESADEAKKLVKKLTRKYNRGKQKTVEEKALSKVDTTQE